MRGMGALFGSEARFGARSLPRVAAREVRGEDIRRGVAALNALARRDRGDRLARASCLFYALRNYTGGVPVDTLVSAVDMRIVAFELLVATRPRLIGRDAQTATLETAVYEAVATETLIATDEGPQFDPMRFSARLTTELAQPAGQPQPTPAPATVAPTFGSLRAG
jgi:hypothetical protein